MPSTENATLQRIQREISDVIEREKELRNGYGQNTNNNEYDLTNNHTPPPSKENISASTHIQPAKVLNGTPLNSNRRFAPNPAAKGVMHKFFKSRGKLSTVTSFQSNTTPFQSWGVSDYLDTHKTSLEPGKRVRKGYVPVQERMKKEFEDLHNREMELRSERSKSQPHITGLIDFEPSKPESNLRAAKSMAQLYDPDEFSNEISSAPASLKPARSLAELCDAFDDDLEIPGSHSLIRQWEDMIQKNQQTHI